MPADIKQGSKKDPKPVQAKRQLYLVSIDGIAPVKLVYRVFAESEDIAFELVNKNSGLAKMDGPPRVDYRHLKKQKATVKDGITGIINWIRNF